MRDILVIISGCLITINRYLDSIQSARGKFYRRLRQSLENYLAKTLLRLVGQLLGDSGQLVTGSQICQALMTLAFGRGILHA